MKKGDSFLDHSVLLVPWTVEKTNEWVLETAGVARSLMESFERRKFTASDILQESMDAYRQENYVRGRASTLYIWTDIVTYQPGLQ